MKKEKVPIRNQQIAQGGFGAAQQFGTDTTQPIQYSWQEVPKNVHINLNQWLISYSKNPDKNQYYTVQKNSAQEVLERAEGIIGKIKVEDGEKVLLNGKQNEIVEIEQNDENATISRLEKKLKGVQKNMEARQQEQAESMMTGLEITKVKNQQILSQLIRIFGKFDKLVSLQGRAKVCNFADRDSLQNAQNKILMKIHDPNRKNGGLLVKVEDVQSTIRYTEAIDEQLYQKKFEEHGTEDSTLREEQEITDDDLQDMFNVLKKQKKGIDILTESINESTRQLMVMEREIELGSGQRRLAARQAYDF